MSEQPLPALPDSCWPVDTSCLPDWDAWEVPPDPDADPPVAGVPVYTEHEKAVAVAWAAQSLRVLTAYRVGGCPVTVRPCRIGCATGSWSSYPAGGVSWTPVQVGGTWLNVGCGCGQSCGCSPLSEVTLYGVVGEVLSVTVDGITLPPESYRLDRGNRLVRLDGDSWPTCQDLALADTEPGTWSVTYTPGEVVDGLGAVAAGALAGEFLAACTGGECSLPSSVQQIVRQGVTITLATGLFPEGRTGIRLVDAYLDRWNPNRLTAQPTVWSPDVRRPR